MSWLIQDEFNKQYYVHFAIGVIRTTQIQFILLRVVALLLLCGTHNTLAIQDANDGSSVCTNVVGGTQSVLFLSLPIPTVHSQTKRYSLICYSCSSYHPQESLLSSSSSINYNRYNSHPHRCGYVTLIGAPNTGKSTLLNALLDEELCITTRLPQTTRHAILGILHSKEDACQVLFLDTPGVLSDPSYLLQEVMMGATQRAVRDADVVVVVVDPSDTDKNDERFFGSGSREIRNLLSRSRPRKMGKDKTVIVALNKADLWTGGISAEVSTHVHNVIASWCARLPDALIIAPVTAANGANDVGVKALRTLLLGCRSDVSVTSLGEFVVPRMFWKGRENVMDKKVMGLLPLGPALYHGENLSDRNERFFASEIIRATLFRILQEELPYCCEVQIESFRYSRRGLVSISASILVERESQKGMVVGKAGRKVREIGIDARKKLEDFLHEKVYLVLNVKVDTKWRNDKTKLKAYGYLK